MRLAIAILLALGLASSASAAPERRSIPARFLGDWASSEDRCTPGIFDDANLRITRRTYQDQNGKLLVRKVAGTGPDQIQLTGPIASWEYEPSTLLTLADDGRMLIVGAEEDTSYYVRCRK